MLKVMMPAQSMSAAIHSRGEKRTVAYCKIVAIIDALTSGVSPLLYVDTDAFVQDGALRLDALSRRLRAGYPSGGHVFFGGNERVATLDMTTPVRIDVGGVSVARTLSVRDGSPVITCSPTYAFHRRDGGCRGLRCKERLFHSGLLLQGAHIV